MSDDRSPAELEADFLAVARMAAEVRPQPKASTTLLHIGDEHLVVLRGPGTTPETTRRLDLGAARIARDFFHRDPPTSREVERAIDFVEDELMRLGKQAEVASTIWSTAAALRVWAAVSGATMTIETVERWFQQLASVSLGQPAAMRGLPTGREAAASLLVLREFMHHGGHACVVFVEPQRPFE